MLSDTHAGSCRNRHVGKCSPDECSACATVDSVHSRCEIDALWIGRCEAHADASRVSEQSDTYRRQRDLVRISAGGLQCDAIHRTTQTKTVGPHRMRARGAIEAQLTRKELPYCCGSRSVAEDRVLGNARYSGTRWRLEDRVLGNARYSGTRWLLEDRVLGNARYSGTRWRLFRAFAWA